MLKEMYVGLQQTIQARSGLRKQTFSQIATVNVSLAVCIREMFVAINLLSQTWLIEQFKLYNPNDVKNVYTSAPVSFLTIRSRA